MLAICPSCSLEYDVSETIPQMVVGIMVCTCGCEMTVRKEIVKDVIRTITRERLVKTRTTNPREERPVPEVKPTLLGRIKRFILGI